MRARGGLLIAIAGTAVTASAAVAVTVPAKDPSPSIVTAPTLVSRGDIVRISERSGYPNTPVRFKFYPDTYGQRATNASCQGGIHYTRRARTDSRGRVVIRLRPRKPFCRGVLYQAQALIGTGDVPDKFAHFCVRGRTSPTGTACSDNL